MARGAVVQQHGAMTYGVVLCHNGATSFNAVLPSRGGPRETAVRESWRAAGCPIGHAAACGSEKTGSERGAPLCTTTTRFIFLTRSHYAESM
jgi:hypothetical protein